MLDEADEYDADEYDADDFSEAHDSYDDDRAEGHAILEEALEDMDDATRAGDDGWYYGD